MTPSPRLRRLLVLHLAYHWGLVAVCPDVRTDGAGWAAYWHRRRIAEAYFLRRMEPGRGRWRRWPGGPCTEYVTWGKHRRGRK